MGGGGKGGGGGSALMSAQEVRRPSASTCSSTSCTSEMRMAVCCMISTEGRACSAPSAGHATHGLPHSACSATGWPC